MPPWYAPGRRGRDFGLKQGYVLEEAQAAAGHLGVHAHRCQHPDFWRGKGYPSRSE